MSVPEAQVMPLAEVVPPDELPALGACASRSCGVVDGELLLASTCREGKCPGGSGDGKRGGEPAGLHGCGFS